MSSSAYHKIIKKVAILPIYFNFADSDIEQQAYDDPVSIEMDIKDLIRQTLKVIRTLVNK